jgi:hypothetical protein
MPSTPHRVTTCSRPRARWPAGAVCTVTDPRHTLTLFSAGITSALRDRLHGHAAGHLTTEGWSAVRQLILLRTKRKAAEAALSSFMLTTADCIRGQDQRESAPLSTLVLNCFVDIIGQQVPCP